MLGSDLVVLAEPGINCGLSLFVAVVPLSIKHLSSKCSVDAFVISVFPWAACTDEKWLDTSPFWPVLEV